jgi:c-di-GMP-binding flagellar brake protein YcgR
MEENFNRKFPKDRRKFIRVPFKKHLSYRICYNKFNSDKVVADSENISGGGIMFKTKWPPPTMSILAIDLDVKRLREYITQKGIAHDFDVDNLHIENNRIFGEVVRIKEYPESGYYDVSIKFIHRKKKE